MKPGDNFKAGVCSLNCKPNSVVTGESINLNLKNHALEASNWQYREMVGLLHHWAEIFNTEFQLGLQLPAIQVEAISRNCFGTYRHGRNGFGVRHEITVNARHLDRPLALVLCTLLHELLHEWQLLYGKPGRGNYHNRQFKQKASLYGLIINSRGFTSIRPGRFTTLLAKYGIDSAALPIAEDNPVAQRPHGNSKMRKYRCGCTTVRCAVELLAHCDQCGHQFIERPPSW